MSSSRRAPTGAGSSNPSGRTGATKIADLPQEPVHIPDKFQYSTPFELVKRKEKDFNTTGKEVGVSINSFAIQEFPTKSVHQYDVCIPFPCSDTWLTS